MALYMIGIGLDNETDISLRGLEAVKKCRKIYFESYTSQLNCTVPALEKLYGKKIIPADRELVEKKAEQTILKDAAEADTAFLVIGDVFSATTHIDLRIRASEKKIETHIIHGASILSAVGATGLEVYKFGRTGSIPFHNKDVVSPVKLLEQNRKNGMHTLFLLDIDAKRKRLMTVNEALEYLTKNKVKDSELCIGCAAIGSDSPEIKFGKISEIKNARFTKFPQCLIIPGKMHFMEEKALDMYRL